MYQEVTLPMAPDQDITMLAKLLATKKILSRPSSIYVTKTGTYVLWVAHYTPPFIKEGVRFAECHQAKTPQELIDMAPGGYPRYKQLFHQAGFPTTKRIT